MVKKVIDEITVTAQSIGNYGYGSQGVPGFGGGVGYGGGSGGKNNRKGNKGVPGGGFDPEWLKYLKMFGGAFGGALGGGGGGGGGNQNDLIAMMIEMQRIAEENRIRDERRMRAEQFRQRQFQGVSRF